MSIRIHIIYSIFIAILLVIVGVQYFPRLLEKTADIPGNSNKGSYKLRMLSSGDLIFEKHRFLPLASYRDYWGDMSVSSVNWVKDRKLLVTMSDGTKLEITLGDIKLIIPNKSP